MHSSANSKKYPKDDVYIRSWPPGTFWTFIARSIVICDVKIPKFRILTYSVKNWKKFSKMMSYPGLLAPDASWTFFNTIFAISVLKNLLVTLFDAFWRKTWKISRRWGTCRVVSTRDLLGIYRWDYRNRWRKKPLCFKFQRIPSKIVKISRIWCLTEDSGLQACLEHLSI